MNPGFKAKTRGDAGTVPTRREKTLGGVILCALAAFSIGGCGGGGGGSGPVMGNPMSAAPVETKQPEPSKAPTPAVCSLAYWGDSISGMTRSRIGAGISVASHGVIGGTAAAAVPVLLQDPLAERFVALEYGTNDANSQTPYEPAMRSMLERIRAVGRSAVIVGLSNATAGDMVYRATYNALARKLAGEYGATFVDWSSVTWSPADLQPDGVHPDDAYAQRLADALTAAIVSVAPECVAP
jgi:lysophospholipase L1-like esterase